MDVAATITLVALGVAVLVGFAVFALISALEQERRAALIALAVAFMGSLPFFVLAFVPPMEFKLAAMVIMAAVVVAGAALFLWPVGDVRYLHDKPTTRFDERDIITDILSLGQALLVRPRTVEAAKQGVQRILQDAP